MMQTPEVVDLHDASPRGRVIRWVSHAIDTKALVPGAPVPAERRLASHLKVSRSAVRAALDALEASGLVEQPGDGHQRRVAQRRKESADSPPAAEAVLGDTIAIITRSRPDMDRETLNELAAALAVVSGQIESSGHHTLLIHPARLEELGVDSFARTGVKGLLCVDEVDESPLVQQVLEVCRGEIPVVVRGYSPISQGFDRVISDHEGGTYMLTRRLLDQGRCRILRFWRTSGDPAWLAHRDAGYERAMREGDLEPLPAVRVPELPASGISEDSLKQYARLYAGFLLEHVRGGLPVDAILVVTDAHAYQVAASLRLLGLEPNKDVLLAGFDNHADHIAWRTWEPIGPAYTVDKNNVKAGRMMVELLLERRSKSLPLEPVCRVAPASLIDRIVPR